MASGLFKNLKNIQICEIFGLNNTYRETADPDKVNLCIGVYRDDKGLPWTLPVVLEAEHQLCEDKTKSYEYLPLSGIKEFRNASMRLLLGADHKAILEKRVEVFQTPGGAGAMRLTATFLKSELGLDTAYVAKQSWPNARCLVKASGFSEVKEYRYWNAQTKSLNFTGMIEDLKAARRGAMVILQSVGHNPTGVDPTREQWMEIAKVCKENQLIVVLDHAYQGMVSGDLEKDSWSVRYFAEQDMDLFVAQSFSKNVGLYSERVGTLTVITKDGQNGPELRNRIEWNIQKLWVTASAYGARLVTIILNDEVLFENWKGQIVIMTNKIKKMRHELADSLKKLGTPGNWDHVLTQTGMYSYTGLTERQVKHMISKHVFMTNNGRICIPGLTPKNVQYVAKCIDEAVRTYPQP